MSTEPDPIPPITRKTTNFKLNLHERKMREWTKTMNDNFEILDRIVGKLVPTPPPSLSTKTPVLTNAYSARQAGTGILRSTVTDAYMPTVEVSSFYDGDAGTLEAFINGISVGSKVLSEANDEGTYDRLVIVSDSDPYVGTQGKENFYKQLTARFSPSNYLSPGGAGHTFQLKHSNTGDSSTLNVWVDNSGSPSIDQSSVSISMPSTSSGSSQKVASVTGMTIAISVTASSSTPVGEYYLNYTNMSGMHLISLTGSLFNSVDSLNVMNWPVNWTTNNGLTFTFKTQPPMSNESQPVLVSMGSSSPSTPTFSKHVSGVPVLNTGDLLSVSYTVNGAVGNFYNATRVARIESSVANTVDIAPATSPYSSGDPIQVNLQVPIKSNSFAVNASFKLLGYNSKGISASLDHFSNLRVDSISNESQRLKSGAGQFPTKGSTSAQFGDPFDSTESLMLNEELLMEGGVYKFPQPVNYSSFGGPDYSLINGGSYSNFRWVTLNLGTLSQASGMSLTFQNAANFGSGVINSALKIYVKVDGSTGWLDASTAYQGGGVSPADDGDAALVVSSSSTTIKRITFGPTVRSGIVYARIGIQKGSTISFSGVVRS
jgi:hypothetical protein